MSAEDDIGRARNVEFIRSAQPVLAAFARYFRPEVRGLDRLPPKGTPFLVVGNHSGGQSPPDLPILLTAWWRERGIDEPVYALFHSMFIGLPLVGDAVSKAGGLEAGTNNAQAVLSRGGVVIVFPGGDHEVLRPWKDRFKIDFANRSGFIRLALRNRVPVVPVTSAGTHESVVVLARGERLAKLLRLDKLMRVKAYPLVVGPPWGIAPPGMPTIPLPAKVTVEVGEPLAWHERYGPEAAEDDEVVAKLYDEITSGMQATMDRLVADRRWPILG